MVSITWMVKVKFRTWMRGIQWIPGDGQPAPEHWLSLLKRIRDGGKLCQVFVRPEGALKIVRTLGGRGFLFVIQPGTGELESLDKIQAFLHTLAKDDITLNSNIV